MPLLLIDATAVSPHAKGVGKYTREIVTAAVARLPAEWSIRLLVSEDIGGEFSADRRLETTSVGWANELLRGGAIIPLACLLLRPSAVIIPMDEAVYVPFAPYVVVAHDIPELIGGAETARPSSYRRVIDGLKNSIRAHALQQADHVFCNSEFILQQVRARYGLSGPQTSIAYCGVDPRFYASPPASAWTIWPALKRWRGYVLTFATGDTRESFDLYAPMWEAAGCALEGIGLAIAGVREGDPYVALLKAEFESRGLREGRDFILIPFLGARDFDQLNALYHDADFYLELSGHEGFGMQLAEALACGVTCISSGRGALQEVGAGYPIELPSLEAAPIAATIIESYARALHQRDNAAQVAMTRRYDWGATTRAIMEEVLRLSSRAGAI